MIFRYLLEVYIEEETKEKANKQLQEYLNEENILVKSPEDFDCEEIHPI